MGLYLCIFDDDDEVDGVEVGSYADFERFRSTVTGYLEGGKAGARFPTLILHSDCDGEWSPADCETLDKELTVIAIELKRLPPTGVQSDWQRQVAKSLGLKPTSLFDSFVDVDGEPLVDRLQRLCRIAIEHGTPIVFQ
jgi:hypothetical protein